MTSVSELDRSAIAGLVELHAEDVVVQLWLEGLPFLAQFRPDEEEIRRRKLTGVESVRSLGLLHALWSIPKYGTAVDSLRLIDLTTLENDQSGLVSVEAGRVQHSYAPPGEVLLFAARRSNYDLAIQRALGVPPVFGRAALWDAPKDEGHRESVLLRTAQRNGVGLGELRYEREWEIIQRPRQPITGVQGVYRWFVAELAFESWLQAQRAQLSS